MNIAMRKDILCRGKRTDNNEWIEGYYAELPKNTLENVDKDLVDEYNTTCIVVPRITSLGTRNYKVYLNTVGQYIGISDKNRTKIFEGDILKVFGYDGLFVVAWMEDGAQYMLIQGEDIRLGFGDFWSYDLEVVGNIFDNADLLKN